MPVRREKFSTGEVYHLYNRGVLKSALYTTPGAYTVFIALIERHAQTNHIQVLAFCLMPNHFHLIVYVDEGGNVSKFMKELSQGFSQWINWRHRRLGTIYQGRFNAKHIYDLEYLFGVCRYVHLNPVRGGLVRRPEDWEYSNYREMIGERSIYPFAAHVARNLGIVCEAYRAFVEEKVGVYTLEDREGVRSYVWGK